MIKEFKKNIGDDVWVIYDNKPLLCYIFAINYCEFISCVSFEMERCEKYTLKSKTDDKYIDQFELKDIFDSKEDLIKSL